MRGRRDSLDQGAYWIEGLEDRPALCAGKQRPELPAFASVEKIWMCQLHMTLPSRVVSAALLLVTCTSTFSETRIVRASDAGARLDSHLLKGGGTDDTAVLQSILDRASHGKAGASADRRAGARERPQRSRPHHHRVHGRRRPLSQRQVLPGHPAQRPPLPRRYRRRTYRGPRLSSSTATAITSPTPICPGPAASAIRSRQTAKPMAPSSRDSSFSASST